MRGGTRFSVSCLRSRRLTEPLRPASVWKTKMQLAYKNGHDGCKPVMAIFVRPRITEDTLAPHVHSGSVSRYGLTQLTGNRTPPHRRDQAKRKAHLKRLPLFGREESGGEKLLSEKPPLPTEFLVISLPSPLATLRWGRDPEPSRRCRAGSWIERRPP